MTDRDERDSGRGVVLVRYDPIVFESGGGMGSRTETTFIADFPAMPEPAKEAP